MKPTFISLRIKMLVVIVLRITIVYLVMYLWIYNFFTDSSTRALRADVETLLDAGSASISGDVVAGLTAAAATGNAAASTQLTQLLAQAKANGC